MVTTTSLGKVAFMPKGEWNSASTYSFLDVVVDDGSSFVAKQAVPAGIETTSTAYWQMLSEKGEVGPTGEQGITGPTGSTGNVYYATFEVNMDTGRLLMNINENYEGPTFSLEDGNLKWEFDY